MKFKTLQGQTKTLKNVKKYLIDWDADSKSKIQFNTKKFLFPFWKNHIVFEEFRVVGTRFSLDFYNANKRVAVEVQGQQHLKYTPFFHGDYQNNYLHQIKIDQMKAEFCEINDINLVEVYYNDDLSLELFESQGVKL
tara:strand:+ start:128 stop:538 length:411 start_codon:yes stop_codon:yes gene_type:complete